MDVIRARPIVLVVDDEALLRANVAEILTVGGYAILQAANADEALRILDRRGDDISLVFTDVVMPGSMDGLELLHRVAVRWPEIRLVVTSGRADIAKGDLPDGVRFCPKPYPKDELIAVMSALLPRGRFDKSLH